MALLDIIIIPDPLLKTVSAPIGDIDTGVRKLADNMLETMYEAPGIGLAAIQVAVPRRMLVMDVARKDEPKTPMVLINPEVIWASQEFSVYEEGCLSIPEYYEEVERPARVKVRYTDIDGQSKEIDCEGLLATCVQHEIDHLNGILFIDHLSRLKRERVMKKFAKAAKREG